MCGQECGQGFGRWQECEQECAQECGQQYGHLHVCASIDLSHEIVSMFLVCSF